MRTIANAPTGVHAYARPQAHGNKSAVTCLPMFHAGKVVRRQPPVVKAVEVSTQAMDADAVETSYLTARTNIIREHFEEALSVDDVCC